MKLTIVKCKQMIRYRILLKGLSSQVGQFDIDNFCLIVGSIVGDDLGLQTVQDRLENISKDSRLGENVVLDGYKNEFSVFHKSSQSDCHLSQFR